MKTETKPFEIGLCSWCLHHIEAPAIVSALQHFHLRVVHLALGPLAQLPAQEQTHAIMQFEASELAVSCGMVGFPGENYSTLKTIHDTGGLVPDATFEERFGLAMACGRIAHSMGLTQISTHAGFIPEQRERAAFDKLRDRLARLADEYAKMGLALLFETGQESAETLIAFLKALNRPNVGVNFDPANLLLYGKGDPVAAIAALAPYIRHVHAKDAKVHRPAPVEATAWRGVETPLGQGDANLAGVIAALRQHGYRGPLVIEREAGHERIADIQAGITFLQKAL